MTEHGHAKILDFGLAKVALGQSSSAASLGASPTVMSELHLTSPGTALGTIAYMSPEQAAGEAATPASDVYSFGVILYRMLTGRLPFESADGLALVAMHRDQPPPPLFGLRPDAPAKLESLAMAALAKSPADRPRNGTALVAELAW